MGSKQRPSAKWLKGVSADYVELLLAGGVFGSAFTLASLAGWSAGDPSWLEPGPGRVENWCGPLGAFVADVLYAGVGYGAWFVVLPMGWCALGIAGRFRFEFGRWLCGLTLYGAFLSVLHLAFRPGFGFPPGGWLGSSLAEGLEGFVGPVGAWILIFGAVVISASILLRVNWRTVAESAVMGVEGRVPAVREIADRGAKGVGGLFGALLGFVWSAFVAAGQRGWRRLTKSFHGFNGVFRRMGESLTRADRPEWATAAVSGGTFLPEDPEEPLTPADLTPKIQRGLAEVEWDRTESGDTTVLDMFPNLTPRQVRSDPGTAGQSPAAAEEVDEKPSTPTPRAVSKITVHHNQLLDQKVEDDGKAVVRLSVPFKLPTLSLLDEVPFQKAFFDDNELRRLAALVKEKLLSFKIGGRIIDIRPGPVVTIFEFRPDANVKVSRIASLEDDLAMALKARSVRIVAPVPGKDVVGIEIPSPTRLTIYLRELLASQEFRDSSFELPCVLGKDVEGRPVVADLTKMPHLLIGGTTGSGKSVGVNGILMSLLYTRTPEQLRFLLVDPKKLEFELYHHIPHLLYPIMTEAKEAAAALAWACREMDDRYGILARWGTRNVAAYNEKVERELKDWTAEKARKYAPKDWTELDGPLAKPAKLPYIVIIIDELADLMMVAKGEVEESICRIAQKARAAGIHLVVATQRPSVDVVTGLIKANLPTRISYQLRTKIDSKVILDAMGAETLLGRGDLLFMPPGIGNMTRCHGAFVGDDEVSRVTDFLRAQGEPVYQTEVVAGASDIIDEGERDEHFDDAVQICIQAGKASTSLVQRHLKIGYNRAATIIEQMEQAGLIGPADGARPREILVNSWP